MSEEKDDQLIAADLQQEMTKAAYLYGKENDVEPRHLILALNRMVLSQVHKLFRDE